MTLMGSATEGTDAGSTDSAVSTLLAAAALSLARGFAQGSTLWCWAPGASQHAQHVAVEFVHPVVAGARALPAVALEAGDPVATLRPLVSPGDMLLVIADASAAASPVWRRADIWGLEAFWIGAGLPPGETSPLGESQILWLGEDSTAWHDGSVVRGYHLLWELTHICFEHPGLLKAEPADTAEICVTCSDEGRLGEVLSSAGDLGEVRTANGLESVNVALVGEVSTGDIVLVHAGMAISVVDQ